MSKISNLKKTKLGYIPEDWEVKRLQEIGSVKRGAGSQYINYVENPKDGIRLIRITDFLKNEPKYVENNDEMQRFLLEKNDLLIAGTGATAGITFEVPQEFVGLAYSYNAPRIKLKDKVCKAFILYVLKSAFILKQQHALFTGNAQPFLDTKAIGGFKIPLPPLPEQKKIAAVLGTWDAGIATLKQLITAKEQHKKGLMQQLFPRGEAKQPQKRFPGFDGDWEEVRLGEVAEIVGGGTPSTSIEEFWDGDINWFTPTEIKYKYVRESRRKISELGLKKSSAKLLPKGSLLLTSRATIAEVAFCQNSCSTNQGFQSLLFKDASLEFLYYWINQNRKQFIRRSSGSTFLEISKKEIEKIKLNLPSKAEQRQIAAVLSAADEEITQLKAQFSALQLQKKGLMQKLLSGEVRVKVKQELT